MRLADVASRLKLNNRTGSNTDPEVTSGYAADLLSDVLAKAGEGTIWATNQRHQNVVGVAVMLNLAGVVMCGGIEPDQLTLQKAEAENVHLYTTDLTLYELVGRLYEMGIKSA